MAGQSSPVWRGGDDGRDDLKEASNFFNGIADPLTGGMSTRALSALGYGDFLDPNSKESKAGGWIGSGLGVVTGFANPCRSLAAVGYGIRLLGGLQASGSILNGVDNVREGNYFQAAMDFLDVGLGTMSVFGSCFGAGTPILTPDGPRAIERLRRGDLVLSRHEDDPSGPVEPRVVEEVFERLGELWDLEVGGRTIRTTAEHPFWVDGLGWTDAARLAEGDRLATLTGDWAVVVGMSPSGELATVYNMQVSGYHTYFVGGAPGVSAVWSHNAKKCSLGGADSGGGLKGTGVNAPNKAGVQPYETGTYGDLTKRSQTGDKLALDHQPSNASNLARAEAEKGSPLTAAERRQIRDQGAAVAVPEDLHASASPTYKGRNTPAQIQADATNPLAAAIRDSQAMIDAAPAALRAAAEAAASVIRNLAGG